MKPVLWEATASKWEAEHLSGPGRDPDQDPDRKTFQTCMEEVLA